MKKATQSSSFPPKKEQGSNLAFSSQIYSQERGLIHLKKSFKDCARPLPPPTSDTTYWPSLGSKITIKNQPKDKKNNYDSTKHTNYSHLSVWDRRINQIDRRNNEVSTIKQELKNDPIDWFENPDSIQHTSFTANHSDHKYKAPPQASDTGQPCPQYVSSKMKSDIDFQSNQMKTLTTSKSEPEKYDDQGWSIVAKKSKSKSKKHSNEQSLEENTIDFKNSANKKLLPANIVNPTNKLNEHVPNDSNNAKAQRQKYTKKLERKIEREVKIKLQREQARRDTKIKFVSANDLAARFQSVPLSKKNEKIASNSVIEQRIESPKKFETKESFSENFPSFCSNAEKEGTLSYAKKVAKSSKSPPKKPVSKMGLKGLSSSSGIKTEEIVKKNVKTKDPIMFDLFAAVKRPEPKKPKAARAPRFQTVKEKLPVKNKGKVRENAKKKLTVLKKNMLAEQKARKEKLLLFLAEQMIAEHEKSFEFSLNNTKSEDRCKVGKQETDKSFHLPEKTSDKQLHSSPTDISDKENNSGLLSKEGEIAHSNKPRKKNKKKDIVKIPETDSIVHDQPAKMKDTVSTTTPETQVQDSNLKKEQLYSQITESRINKYRDSEAWHQNILFELNPVHNSIHGSKFREYCDQVLNSEVDSALETFLRAVITLQFNHYKRDPVKAKIRQRCYYGLKETGKHMKQMSCIVIAPDIKKAPGPGNLDELVYKVISQAKNAGIPILYGLTMAKLRYIAYKKSFVSCIGVVNFEGAQEKYAALMEHITVARKQYQDLLMKYKNDQFVSDK